MSDVASEHELRLEEYERQVDDLQSQLKALEEEVLVLRRRLQDAPKRVRTLEERLLETKGQLAQAVSQNEKLSATLRRRASTSPRSAKRSRSSRCRRPPTAPILGANDDGTVDVFSAGRKMRVIMHPEVDVETSCGDEVALNESLNVVLARRASATGEVVIFKEMMRDGKRALIVGRADEERVCELGVRWMA